MITKKGQDYSLNGIDWYNTTPGTYLLASNNLSDLVNVATAKVNLGIPSITNQTNNRIITSTAVTDVLNGEANLTFNGTTLTCTGGASFSGNTSVVGAYFGVAWNNATAFPMFQITQASTGDASMYFDVGGGTRYYAVGIDNNDGDRFKIYGADALSTTDALCGFVYDYNAGTALVGIGENTPLYTLHVNGTFYLTGAYSTDLRFDAANRLIAPADSGTRALTIRGSDVAGAAGGVTLRGGISSGAAGGTLTILGGDGPTTGGSITILAGASAGTPGSIYIGENYGSTYISDAANTCYVQIGSAQTPQTLKGILHVTGSSAVNTFPHLFLENLNTGFDTAAIFCWDATTYYSVGIDQSTARTFKIYNGTALGATAANIGYSFIVSGGLPYVGIGKEAAAVYTLDVTGDIRCTDDLFVNDDATITGLTTISEKIDLSVSAAATDPILDLTNAAAGDVTAEFKNTAISYSIGIDDTDDRFKIYAGVALGVTDANCGVVYNYNAGVPRVGIGINNPKTTLDVNGNCIIGASPGDAASPSWSNVKTLYYTIGTADTTGCDYEFTSVGNTTEQDIQLGGAAIIPAYSRVIDVVIVCTAALVGGTMAVDVGATGASAEYIAIAACDALNETFGAIINTAFWVAPVNAASSVYFCATPSANWDTLTLGKWAVYVTYIDNSAVA